MEKTYAERADSATTFDPELQFDRDAEREGQIAVGEGLMRAKAATIATQLNDGDFKFLRALARWQHVASSQDIGPQTSQDENRARQKCKRKGLVTFEDGYWRTTDLGRLVLR